MWLYLHASTCIDFYWEMICCIGLGGAEGDNDWITTVVELGS